MYHNEFLIVVFALVCMQASFPARVARLWMVSNSPWAFLPAYAGPIGGALALVAGILWVPGFSVNRFFQLYLIVLGMLGGLFASVHLVLLSVARKRSPSRQLRAIRLKRPGVETTSAFVLVLAFWPVFLQCNLAPAYLSSAGMLLLAVDLLVGFRNFEVWQDGLIIAGIVVPWRAVTDTSWRGDGKLFEFNAAVRWPYLPKRSSFKVPLTRSAGLEDALRGTAQ